MGYITILKVYCLKNSVKKMKRQADWEEFYYNTYLEYIKNSYNAIVRKQPNF